MLECGLLYACFEDSQEAGSVDRRLRGQLPHDGEFDRHAVLQGLQPAAPSPIGRRQDVAGDWLRSSQDEGQQRLEVDVGAAGLRRPTGSQTRVQFAVGQGHCRQG